jgi:thiamine-phosphate pyrophosphorylase
VTPPGLASGGLDPQAFAPILASALDAGDVASLLLRLPGAADDAVRRAADLLRPIAQDRDVAFLLNDRPDLAVETGADGVHLEDERANLAAARRLLGPDAIVGAAGDLERHRAMVAAERGADYIAFGRLEGPEEPTPEDAAALAELIGWWSELMTVPSVALGAFTPDNCAPIVHAGADFLSVGSGVWDHPDGAAAGVRAFLAAIDAAQP